MVVLSGLKAILEQVAKRSIAADCQKVQKTLDVSQICEYNDFRSRAHRLLIKTLGYRQMVRQRTLTPSL